MYETFSQRRRGKPRFERVDGVPEHLVDPLADEVILRLGRSSTGEDLYRTFAITHHVTIPSKYASGPWLSHQLRDDEDLLLDAVDFACKNDWTAHYGFETILDQGGSIWRATSNGLEDRVLPQEVAAMEAATGVADAVSEHLVEAWDNAFGREKDPDDAWDHAIQAVEAILGPVVTPNDKLPQLGKMLRAMRDAPQKWSWVLAHRGKEGDVNNPPDVGCERLESMLRPMWPNPARHGEPGASVSSASVEQAQAVVQLAVLVVGLVRDGGLVNRQTA